MAISARVAQLLEQRRASKALSSFGTRIRTLAPSNNVISTISKQTATAELNSMVSKYNNGQVSNEDMRLFLEKMANNSALSTNDRLEVQNQIADFDNRIKGDQLTTAYKAAPDNSLAQVQAATALAQFYTQRASTMQPGTPAHSQALENAAEWNAKVTDINQNIKKVASQNLRYQEEAKVNALPSNSAGRAKQKAEMWQKLYDQAVTDGDVVSANKYAANYQQEITTAQELASKEDVQAEKSTLTDFLNKLANDYHDGRIGEQEYLQALADVSPRIDATNDYGLINALNRTTDTVQKNLDKGGLRRGTTASGLPTVLGKGKGNGNSTSWDQEDFNYSDNLKFLKEKLDSGEINGQQYAQAIADIVTTRDAELEKRIQAVHDVASTNPNAKIVYNGKKQRAADILDSLYSEQDSVAAQADAVQSGNFGIVMVAPKEFSKTGSLTKGKSTATYEIVDTRNLPQDRYVQDSDGIYHEILKKQIKLTPEQASQATLSGGVFYDENGTGHFVKTDASGNPYIEQGQYVEIYDPGSSKKFSIDIQPGQTVDSYATMSQKEQQKAYDEKIAKLKQPQETQSAVEKSQVQSNNAIEQAKQIGSKVLQTINPTKNSLEAFPNNAVKVGNAIGTVAQAVKNVITPVTPPLVKSVPVNIPANTQITLPKPIQPTVANGSTMPQIQMPQLKNVGTPTPSPLQKVAQEPNFKPVQVPSPPKAPTTGPNLKQQATGILQGLKNLATKILPFKF